jgi:hypothetical protein
MLQSLLQFGNVYGEVQTSWESGSEETVYSAIFSAKPMPESETMQIELSDTYSILARNLWIYTLIESFEPG